MAGTLKEEMSLTQNKYLLGPAAWVVDNVPVIGAGAPASGSSVVADTALRALRHASLSAGACSGEQQRSHTPPPGHSPQGAVVQNAPCPVANQTANLASGCSREPARAKRLSTGSLIGDVEQVPLWRPMKRPTRPLPPPNTVEASPAVAPTASGDGVGPRASEYAMSLAMAFMADAAGIPKEGPARDKTDFAQTPVAPHAVSVPDSDEEALLQACFQVETRQSSRNVGVQTERQAWCLCSPVPQWARVAHHAFLTGVCDPHSIVWAALDEITQRSLAMLPRPVAASLCLGAIYNPMFWRDISAAFRLIVPGALSVTSIPENHLRDTSAALMYTASLW